MRVTARDVPHLVGFQFVQAVGREDGIGRPCSRRGCIQPEGCCIDLADTCMNPLAVVPPAWHAADRAMAPQKTVSQQAMRMWLRKQAVTWR